MKGGVLVVGFGNPLVGDDGAGPAVVEALAGRLLREPRGWLRADEGGADATRIPQLWRGEGEIWLVDALIKGEPPGTVHHLSHEAILTLPQRHATAHYLSLPECLRWIALGHPEIRGVRYRMWGIEPGELTLGARLSPPVVRAVRTVVEEILAATTEATSCTTRS